MNIMQIERTKDEVIFRLPADTDIDDLQAMIDFFEYIQIVKKSKASQQDVDDLVKEVKKGRWAKTKSKLNL